MDIGILLLTHTLTLIGGLIVQYVLYVLQERSDRQKRKSDAEVERWKRSSEIFVARAEYIQAHTRVLTQTRPARVAQLQADYERLFFANRDADPQALVDRAIFHLWEAAEENASDKTIPLADRLQEIKEARLAVSKWIGEKRAALR